VLFDLDGVLVDSMAVIEGQIRLWALRYRLDPDSVVELSRGRRDEDIVRAAAPFLDVETEVLRIQQYELDGANLVRARAGAIALTSQLPPLAWAVVTSGRRVVACARMAAAGLLIPRTLVTAEDVDAGKPAPDGYLMAARWLDVPPEDCVVFEDAPAGVAAARSAGMRVIGVLGSVPPRALDAETIVSDLSTVMANRADSTIELSLPAVAGPPEHEKS